MRKSIANLQETLDELNRKLFGKSSEQTRPEPSEEGTAEGTEAGSGRQEIHVKEHIRNRQPKSSRERAAIQRSPSGRKEGKDG